MYKCDNDNKIKSVTSKNKSYGTINIQVNNSEIGWSITLMWGND